MNRILIVMMLISSLAFGQTATESASQIAYDGQGAERSQRKGRIEPNAGKWRTWVIPSGRDYRVAAPPSRWETKVEARQVADLVS